MKSNILSKGVLQRMIEMAFIQGAISKVLGDLVSKVVSDGVDISIKGIKDADQNRKSYSQNLQTQIYHIIVDALNELTYDKYKEQNKLYNAAESILKGFINSKDNTDVVKSGLKMLVSQVSDEVCEDFLGILCREICKDENSDLYKEIDMLWEKQENEYIHKEFNDLKEAINYIINRIKNTESYREIHIKDRAEEYAQKWNKNVFLNNFNVEDQNAGVNIKLKDIYLEEHLPHYIWKTNTRPSDKLKNLLKRHIIDNNERKMLLILGQPGIGKSTLITWVMANLVEKKEQVLVYQFASDLKKINWQGEDILEEIFKALRLGDEELESKVLILDGFDEISISGDRERILNKLNQELKKMNRLDNFSLIITCRENYVAQSNLENIDYITLQTWNEDQIKSFCEIYGKENTKEESEIVNSKISEIKINKILEKKEIFGIPLILYMVLALDVAIEKSSSIVDIYDQIFSLKRGGIYDRCYDVEHRINEPEIKKHIHRISQQMAFWMFENNADKAIISQEKFEEICENEMKESEEKGEDIKGDTLIGNFFNLKHSEGKGTDELQFVHRSIYEYFVVIYFFDSIHKLSSKEEVAGKLGELLKDGHLSEQILEFIKYKFDNMKRYNLPRVTKEFFNIMLKDGMLYYTQKQYKNSIEREMNIFFNMLELVHLWNPMLGILDNKIVFYLRYNKRKSLMLKGIQLKRVNLKGASLEKADLREADLKGINLEDSNLEGADLENANLEDANLMGADLKGVNLKRADLKGADLRNANLKEVDLKETNLRGVNLRETNLKKMHLESVDLSGVDLSGTDLRYANLKGANLTGADLRRADLKGADLYGADLKGANLKGANLEGVDLRGADLKKLDLKGVDLKKVNLAGADLKEADLSGVSLEETNLEEANLKKTNLKGTDLSKAYTDRIGLEKVRLLGAYLRKIIIDKK